VLCGRYGNTWQCEICRNRIEKKELVVDHVDPVVSPKLGWQGWDEYYKRLFCPAAQLQVIHKTCHRKKTNEENAERRKNK